MSSGDNNTTNGNNISDDETIEVVFLRHGESEWNNENLFCGWVDVNLSDIGLQEAKRAGEGIKNAGYEFDMVYTSELKRAYNTANIVLEVAFGEDKSKWPSIHKSINLIERHYGALTGKNKAQMVREYGEEQVQIWRRTYDIRPPPMDADHPCYERIVSSPIFADVSKENFPAHESLKDLVQRTVPFWVETVEPELRSGKQILVVAHGTSLRGLVKHVKNLDESMINKLNLPTGIPFVLTLNKTSLRATGETKFLADDETVRKATEKVAKISMK